MKKDLKIAFITALLMGGCKDANIAFENSESFVRHYVESPESISVLLEVSGIQKSEVFSEKYMSIRSAKAFKKYLSKYQLEPLDIKCSGYKDSLEILTEVCRVYVPGGGWILDANFLSSKSNQKEITSLVARFPFFMSDAEWVLSDSLNEKKDTAIDLLSGLGFLKESKSGNSSK